MRNRKSEREREEGATQKESGKKGGRSQNLWAWPSSNGETRGGNNGKMPGRPSIKD